MLQDRRTVLAATIHDPEGRLLPALGRSAGLLHDTFSAFALNATSVTHPEVLSRIKLDLGAAVLVQPPNERLIGKARRDSVALALEQTGEGVLYCDFDHAMRWAETDIAEMRALIAREPNVDFFVIGRSERSFSAEPERLKRTESLVNHTYALMTGRRWDLMFAIRRFSRAAALEIVCSSRVDTIANDVEWPFLAENAGFSIGYAAADGLFYRTMEEYGARADTLDDDPLEWIRRVEFAALQAAVMRPYLRRG